MEDFIAEMAGELGQDEGTVRRAAGGMLQAIGQSAPKEDFQNLLARVPGAEGLMASAPGAAQASGAMAGLVGKATSMLGGSSGSGLGVLSCLTDAGLGLEDAPRFAKALLGFLEGKAGAGALESILSSVPDLKRLF